MLFEKIVEYFQENPIQSAIILALTAATAVIVVTLIILTAKKKACTTTQSSTPSAVADNDTQTVKKEELPLQMKPEAPTISVDATPQKEEKPAKETIPLATQPQPKSPSDAKNAKGTNAANAALKATKKLGGIFTKKPHDAPQEADNQKAAEALRYTGKWVVCKLLLVDSDDNLMEENYFFELRASNGEKLLVSEEYTSQAGAIKGIQTHKDNVKKDNFRITVSKKGDYIFKLLTAKNTLLCTGANYKSLERCESAIASTKRFAATAILQEEMEELKIKLPPDDENEPVYPDNGYNGKWIISTTGNEEIGVMYYFELLASNGEKLLTSEEYSTYEGAYNAVETHKANIAKGNFRISITKRGDYLFKLLGGNGQLLCLGEHYKTRSRCESAVESVKRFSKSAPIYKYGEINKE